MIQLPLDLTHPPAFGRADFLVSESNAVGLDWIDRWPNWPGGVLVLHGPGSCGKTHLAHIWAAQSAALLIAGASLGAGDFPACRDAHALAVDDAEQADEVALFHLFNACREHGGSLLVVARAAPQLWPMRLPDLASRLRGAVSVGIEPPDDGLLGAVLVKHFADRRLSVPPEVVRYVLRRMPRSFAAAAEVAAALDRLALSRHAPVTVPLARALFAESSAQSSVPPSDLGVA